MDIDKQHEYLLKYSVDPIEVGELCQHYPALKNSWNNFINVLEICRTENEVN